MTTAKPTVASLQRKIERLEAQLASAHALNLRIGSSDWDRVFQNSDMRVALEQIAEIAREAAL